jgi:hypothetical protein
VLCLAGLFLIWKYSSRWAQAWVPALNLILLGLTVAAGDDQRVTMRNRICFAGSSWQYDCHTADLEK